MIFVTGATGNVGAELVRALIMRGQEVRGLVRPSSRAALPAGAESIIGDLDRPETFSAALAGVRGVFLLSGYKNMSGLLAEIRRAKVERIVLLSSSSAPGGDMNNAVARYHILSEAAVRESGVPWTILRPFVDGKLDESKVLPTVEEVIGRQPHTFERWAIAHADAFR